MHQDWTNIDYVGFRRFVPESLRWALLRSRLVGRDVRIAYYDLRRGIPFPDRSVEAIYISHVLEHIDRADVGGLLTECRRALKEYGVLRIVVPDLERIVREYLAALDDARHGVHDAQRRYDFALLELFDQMVRREPGGEVAKWLPTLAPARPTGLLRRMAYATVLDRSPGATGELHRWMYDAHSLARLLADAGFEKIARTSHLESAIPGWLCFQLDAEPDGRPYLPGSLYVECVKPA